MNKVKAALKAFLKYHFWALWAIVLLAPPICWFFETRSLATQWAAQEAKIKKSFNDVTAMPTRPNRAHIEAINKQEKELEKQVYKAWKSLYQKQKEQMTISPDIFSGRFKNEFDSLQPGRDLLSRYLNEYRNRVPMLLPELLKIGDVCRPEHSSKMRPLDADNRLNPNEREIGTVVWNSKDYQRVVDRFTWKPTGPSLTTSDVLLAQEDLYVYQTLLKVVKTTNEGAASKDNAAIKRIDRLAVGRDATNAWQEAKVNIAESNRPESAGGPLKPSDLQSEEARRAAMKAARKAQRSGETEQAHLDIGEIVTQSEMMADATDGSSLIINRYVKDNGSPVGVAAPETGTNRASGRGNPAAAATPTITHPFKEFRMLPIHMKLVVDERKLPVLLAACANANLPICIRQIDMVKPERKSGMQELVGGAGGSAWDQMNPTQRARALRESKMAAEELAEARKDKEAESRAQRTKESLEQFDMTVNIFGLVLIYNPPDSTQFAEAAKAIKEEESKATESGEAPTSTFDDSPTPPAARKDAADAGSAKASRAEKSDARADRGEIDAVGRRCVALGKSTLSRRGAPS